MKTMDCPKELRYLKSHEWARKGGGRVRVGITDFAQSELTDVVYVELPQVGRAVQAGEAVAVIESVKTAVDVYGPVSGTVVAVNEALSADPGLINREPYRQGWLFELESGDPAQWDGLMDAQTYENQLSGH